MDMHAYRWICMHIHGYACLSDSSENTRIPLLCWFLMICNYYKQKWKYRFDRKIKIWLGNIRSNQVFYWKPNMILWSLRSFWVERFDLNQSQKIDFGRKSFLYQCKNSARNRFFPRSRLGQMTYRKLKPHASWPLQMRRGVTPPAALQLRGGGIPPPAVKSPLQQQRVLDTL